MRNLSKYNGPSVNPDPLVTDLLSEVCEQVVIKMFRSITSGTRMYTIDEVLQKVELDKSPGFPWNRRYATHADVIDKHRSSVESYVSDAYAGVFRDVYWYAFPKEELRTSEKIQAGKVRHISGCPTEFKILNNTLLLAQNEEFYKCHNTSWSKVGINILDGGWDELARKLAVHSHGIEADISAMDASYQWAIACCVKRIRWALLPESMRTPANAKVLDYIYAQVFQGIQVTPDGYVFKKDHGNASGSPNTVVDNTIATILMVVLSYVMACLVRPQDPEREQVFSEQEMYDHISAAIYGDDNTITVSDECRQWYGHAWLSRAFKSCGWTLEFSSSEYLPWQELTFLSRRFVNYAGHYVPAPLDGSKYMHSLFAKGKKNTSLAESFVRGCGLYIAAYFDTPARQFIGSFLDWATPRLSATNSPALANRLTDKQIERLYLGCGPYTQS